jgi:hypothetical protein
MASGLQRRRACFGVGNFFMLTNIMGFYETQYCFNDLKIDYIKQFKTKSKKLLVKAHEKEIYEFDEKIIAAKIHRDNDGVYPFSKLDFLSHKIQELLYREVVPKLYAADFTDANAPVYFVERITLDGYHKAYNITRQIANKSKGLDYKYDKCFFEIGESDNIYELADKHIEMADEMKVKYSHFFDYYGITFDYSNVNIAWKDGNPVSLEVHKCQRDYLFHYDKCLFYFKNNCKDNYTKEIGLALLRRIDELRKGV